MCTTRARSWPPPPLLCLGLNNKGGREGEKEGADSGFHRGGEGRGVHGLCVCMLMNGDGENEGKRMTNQ